jgi:cysteinyl-tRNA synthetase
MAQAHLGETIDIHAGGNDLLFPHHENEVAQSTCAHGGKIFARTWLHNGMLSLEGRKMSKSLGNTLVLHELLEKFPAELLRYMLLKAHYRQPLDWSAAGLEQAQRTLDGLYTTLRDRAGIRDSGFEIHAAEPGADAGALPSEFIAALLDDLNTPEALAVLSRLADAARKAETPQAQAAATAALLAAGKFLGLLQIDPEAWFQHSTAADALDETRIKALVDARQAAKKAKNFAESDRLRDELLALGIVVEDTAQGPRWKRVSASATASSENRDERAA